MICAHENEWKRIHTNIEKKDHIAKTWLLCTKKSTIGINDNKKLRGSNLTRLETHTRKTQRTDRFLSKFLWHLFSSAINLWISNANSMFQDSSWMCAAVDDTSSFERWIQKTYLVMQIRVSFFVHLSAKKDFQNWNGFICFILNVIWLQSRHSKNSSRESLCSSSCSFADFSKSGSTKKRSN